MKALLTAIANAALRELIKLKFGSKGPLSRETQLPRVMQLYHLQYLLLTLKSLSTLTKTLVPISLAQHHIQPATGPHGGVNFDIVEEVFSNSQENALFSVLILSMVYNWFNTKPPSRNLGIFAVFLQVIL